MGTGTLKGLHLVQVNLVVTKVDEVICVFLNISCSSIQRTCLNISNKELGHIMLSRYTGLVIFFIRTSKMFKKL